MSSAELALGQLVSGGERIVACFGNLRNCGEQAKHEFNKRKDELLKIRDRAIAVATPIIDRAIDDLKTLLPSAQQAFDILVAPYKVLITAGEAIFDQALPGFQEKKEAAYAEAEEQYNQVKDNLADLSAQMTSPRWQAPPLPFFNMAAAIEALRDPACIGRAFGEHPELESPWQSSRDHRHGGGRMDRGRQ